MVKAIKEKIRKTGSKCQDQCKKHCKGHKLRKECKDKCYSRLDCKVPGRSGYWDARYNTGSGKRMKGGRKGMPKGLKKAFKFAGKKLKAYDKRHGLSREAGDKLAKSLLGSL